MSTDLRLPASESKHLSHMPFLCRVGGVCAGVLAFGAAVLRVPRYHIGDVRRVWRLFFLEWDEADPDWTEVRPIRTGFEPNEVECSPCVCEQGGEVHLSFIGSAATGGHRSSIGCTG